MRCGNVRFAALWAEGAWKILPALPASFLPPPPPPLLRVRTSPWALRPRAPALGSAGAFVLAAPPPLALSLWAEVELADAHLNHNLSETTA